MDLDSPGAYGAVFGDVYDDWYGERPDTADAVARLTRWAGDGPVAELGVGTGRLAIPLAAGGVEVHGVDASPDMLRRLAAKPGGDAVVTHLGDMVDGPPQVPGGHAVVVVAFNTFFNLTSAERQAACVTASAAALAPGGRFVIEAFVPSDDMALEGTETSRITPDGPVRSRWRHDPSHQVVEGTYTIGGEPESERPWRIRYCHLPELDAMARAAGLELHHRWASWRGEPFTPDAAVHVSVWRAPEP